MHYSNEQLGYFLDFSIWQDAVNLLEYQLERKRHPNRHFFTLSMSYYESISQRKRNTISKESYFKSRVANNLFFGLSEEFACYPYVQPKSGLGLRNYVFMTYSMRCVYYAVGLYLIKLSSDFIKHMKEIEHIKSFYGGELLYDGGSLRSLNPSSVYYRKHYNRFRKAVMEEIDAYTTNTVCIRLDIANYFDSIKTEILLDFLRTTVDESRQTSLKFNAGTIDQIRDFFDYIALENNGIPQTNNGIISDAIGHLYMLMCDLALGEILSKRSLNFRIIRYVDDVFIFFETEGTLTDAQRDTLVRNLGSEISDQLKQKLSLKTNNKSALFRLDRESERSELTKSLKRVSPDEHVPDDDDTRTPQERADAVIREIVRLKDAELDTRFQYVYTTNQREQKHIALETLKDVFAEPVDNILNEQNNSQRLREAFDGFNFEFVLAHPSSLLSVICRPTLLDVAQTFEEYLMDQDKLTNKEIDLILKFLAQENFGNKRLLNKLKQDPYMDTIISVYESPGKTYRGYFGLPSGRVTRNFTKSPSIIHQIRLRSLAEKRLSYPQALNHLLNEIQSLCHEFHCKQDASILPSIKKYTKRQAIAFLRGCGISEPTILQINKLFDRRNSNALSHPGDSNNPTIDVTPQDYQHYKEQVEICVSHILT